MSRVVSIVLLLLSGCLNLAQADQSQYRITLDQFGGMGAQRFNAQPYPRLAGEFEPARALLLSVSDWQPDHRHILVEIAQKTKGHVHVLVLCNDTHQIKEATGWLLEGGQDYPHVYFCQLKSDTVWIRDFGPVFAQTKEGAQVFDFLYKGGRPRDDALPEQWAKVTGSKRHSVPWTMQGGNLMSNGRGTALITTRVFRDNHLRFSEPDPGVNVEHERRVMVIKALMENCNLSQLVVLEPLQDEATRHVDMFARFISPQDVLLAEIDARTDPVNAQILDRNASRLRQAKVGSEPLRVHRVPIPTRQGTSWSAYTNAVAVGDLVLLPVYAHDPVRVTAAAQAVYERLLPACTVKTIDMTTMKQLQGELHCLSLPVPHFAALPESVYSFAGAKGTYFP